MARPHAVMFPYPAQGHIKPLMQLAKILSERGFYITFVNTEFTHERMLKSGSLQSVNSHTDLFRFETIPDGLPPDHVRTLQIAELSESLQKVAPPHFEKLMEKLRHLPDVPPVKCIISDGVLSFTQQTAKKLGIPRAAFWTPSGCGFSAYFFGPLLIEKGYIPLKDKSCFTNGYMEEVVPCIPGMPPLRVKDLPSFYVVTKGDSTADDYMFEYLKREAQAALEADFVLLNTFDVLEGPAMDALRTRFPIYTIGPLLFLTETHVEDKKSKGLISGSLWTEEMGYVKWLDSQEPSSVIYVCFGSITVMSDEELVEFAWGLEASNQPFLWAIREDLIHGKSAVLSIELLEKTKNRSFFVNWAPQMKILSHPSVGGFLTHNGWNSTLESICAGVPMISWPFFAEQQTNRRFVSQVWKIGMEMNDVVERGEVEQMVRKLMKGEEGEEMRRRVSELKEASIRAISKGGSSSNYLETFVNEMLGKADLID
eukprot:Gb_27984 [translate_table: standard]